MCVFYALVCCVAACLIVLIMYSRIVNVGNNQLPIWLYSTSCSLLGLVRCAVTVLLCYPALLYYFWLANQPVIQQHRCAAWKLQLVRLVWSLAYPSFIGVHYWTEKCSDWLQCKFGVIDVSCNFIGDSFARVHFMGVCTVQVQLPPPVGYFLVEFLTSVAAWLACSAHFICLAAHQQLKSPTTSLWWP